jgi:hypothetical protein
LVCHILKPQAYVRYGDDFVIFFSTRHHAYNARLTASSFLYDSLGLTVNSKNDIVVPSGSGLRFLGHVITSYGAVVDKFTTKSILQKLSWRNAASYRSLALVESEKARMDWILLEKYVDI